MIVELLTITYLVFELVVFLYPGIFSEWTFKTRYCGYSFLKSDRPQDEIDYVNDLAQKFFLPNIIFGVFYTIFILYAGFFVSYFYFLVLVSSAIRFMLSKLFLHFPQDYKLLHTFYLEDKKAVNWIQRFDGSTTSAIFIYILLTVLSI